MSQAPFCVRGVRFGTRLGAPYNVSLNPIYEYAHLKSLTVLNSSRLPFNF